MDPESWWIVKPFDSALGRLAQGEAAAFVPAVVTAVLLASGGGVLAGHRASGLAIAAALCVPALAAIVAGRARAPMLGTAELAGPLFLAVYAATGVAGIYPGAAVPALLHAGLAWAVFRAAAHASSSPEGARRQAMAVVVVAAIAAAIGIVTSLAAGGPARLPAAAPFVARGHLAAFLAAALPMCVALAADSGPVDGGVDGRDGRARLLPLAVSPATGLLVARGALALVIVAIAFTVSRGGVATAGAVLLASLAALVRIPARKDPLPTRIVAAAAIVVLPATAAWIAIGPLAARLSAGALRTSAVERADILRASWTAFQEHPIAGHGAGGFAGAFRAVRPPSVPYFVEHAHADVLELGVESGVLGLASAIIAAALLARLLLGGRVSPLGRFTAAGVLGFAGLLLAGLADFPLRLGAIAALGGWVLGIAAGAATIRSAGRRAHGPDPGDSPAPFPQRAGAALVAIALVAGTLAGAAQAFAASLSRGDEPARVRATRVAPWNAGVWREAADAALARGLAGEPAAFVDAAARFDEALARNPLDAPSLAGRGRLAMLEGDVARALPLLERAVSADPLHPAWRVAHLEALLADGRSDEARDAAIAALELRPDLVSDLVTPMLDASPEDAASLIAALPVRTCGAAATMLFARGDLPSAQLAADRAAAHEPLRFADLAAGIAAAAGDEAGARAALDRALAAIGVDCSRVASGDAFVVDALAAVPSLLSPLPDDALVAAPSPLSWGTGARPGPVLAGWPAPRSAADRSAALALLLRRARMAEPPPRPAECAVALFPASSAAWSFAAEAAAAASDAAAAESAWRRAAALAPMDPSPLIALARFFASRDDLAGALAAAREAEGRSTCAGAGAQEVARLLDGDGRRAAAIIHLEELQGRCANAPWLADALAALR